MLIYYNEPSYFSMKSRTETSRGEDESEDGDNDVM